MEILGFEEFLNRAEKDQLMRMKDETSFSRFFPYALALNVADNWAKAFEGIYQQPPEWYVSPMGGRMFSPPCLTIPLIRLCLTSQAQCSRPAQQRTGGGGFSGSGGSSGGGFGGGGGGSW
jgi:uncharacterized membrane protein YgcG